MGHNLYEGLEGVKWEFVRLFCAEKLNSMHWDWASLAKKQQEIGMSS